MNMPAELNAKFSGICYTQIMHSLRSELASAPAF